MFFVWFFKLKMLDVLEILFGAFKLDTCIVCLDKHNYSRLEIQNREI